MKNLVLIIIAALIYAVGISLFLVPNQLAPGGIAGLSVILNRLVRVKTGTLYFLLNVPIVILGTWKFGLRFIAKTAYSVASISIFTNLLSRVGALTDDLLIGERLMKELDAGVTYLYGKGGWTEEEKQIVFSMVPNRQGAEIRDIVKSEDASAFMVVTSEV